MSKTEDTDFGERIAECLGIPGVTKKKLSEWAGVDPSTVTRWTQGTVPTDPVAVLGRIEPQIEGARSRAKSFSRTQVNSWRPITADMDPGLREYVQRTGLLASRYYVFSSYIPSKPPRDELDAVIIRYFDGVWADMSRRKYNIGDISQTVSLSDDKTDRIEPGPTFDQGESLRKELVEFNVKVAKEIGSSVAALQIGLNLEEFPFANENIGFIGGFGYRYRATRAIASGHGAKRQTNDFLGAPIVLPCRRLNLVVCIPKDCLRGSPSALNFSNRSMLRVLMELDNTSPDEIESMLWPLGQRFELSSSPDAPLKALSRVDSMLDDLPDPLQEALRGPANFDDPGQSVRDVLCDQDSRCFLLDIHLPHPSLTHNVVWRLPQP